MTDAGVTLRELAIATRTTPQQIYQWQARYGWPLPAGTHPRGRRYPRALIDEVRRVLAANAAGRPLRDILATPTPALPPVVAPPALPGLDLRDLPTPTTTDGQAVQRQLLRGLADRHPGRVRHAVAACARLHPRERGPAVLLVLTRARQAHPALSAWLDEILEPTP